MIWKKLKIDRKKILSFIKKNYLIIVILIVGIFARTYLFGTIPNGLNQDEAVNAYDAYAILEYGIDHNGFKNPLFLMSFGSGQSVLPAYLSMPFINFFGLNILSIRLAILLSGLTTLVFFYLLNKEIFNKKIAIITLFLLAISPWHIMLSRWSLECNFFPTFFLIGVYFLIKSLEKKYYLITSSLFFALSLYTYGVAYFIVPSFILISILYLLFNHKRIKLIYFLSSALIFFIISLPVLIYIIINHYDLKSFKYIFFNIPNLLSVHHEEMSLLFGDSSLIQKIFEIKNNIGIFFDIILFQSDGFIWNSIQNYGYMYIISLLPMIFGFVILLKKNIRLKFNKNFFIFLWLLLSILLALIMNANINRINIIFLPLIILTSLGINLIREKFSKDLFFVVITCYVLYFFSFSIYYFKEYPKQIGPAFFESLGEAIKYSNTIKSDSVCITNQINQPYIYVLFYLKLDPHLFIESKSHPGMVYSFDKYYFGWENCPQKGKIVYVFNNSEKDLFKNKELKFKTFKNYSVGHRDD